MEEWTKGGPLLHAKYRMFLPTSVPPSLLLTALGVLRILPVLQGLGDAYGF